MLIFSNGVHFSNGGATIWGFQRQLIEALSWLAKKNHVLRHCGGKLLKNTLSSNFGGQQIWIAGVVET